jgi:hypothetical protein
MDRQHALRISLMRTYPVVVAFLTTCAAAVAQSRATADWLKLNLAALEGKKHSIQVAYVTVDDPVRGYRAFRAHTYDNETWSGTLCVLVPEAQRFNFAKRYGTEIQWQRAPDGIRVATKRFDGYVFRLKNDPAMCTDGPPAPFGEKPVQLAPGAEIRTWTHVDGRTIEAEFVSSTSTQVTFRRASDGKVFTFELSKLSQADRDYVETVR